MNRHRPLIAVFLLASLFAASLAGARIGEILPGDADQDGALTVADLVTLVNHVGDPAGHPLTTLGRTAGDVFPAERGDGVLDARDVSELAALLLKAGGGKAGDR